MHCFVTGRLAPRHLIPLSDEAPRAPLCCRAVGLTWPADLARAPVHRSRTTLRPLVRRAPPTRTRSTYLHLPVGALLCVLRQEAAISPRRVVSCDRRRADRGAGESLAHQIQALPSCISLRVSLASFPARSFLSASLADSSLPWSAPLSSLRCRSSREPDSGASLCVGAFHCMVWATTSSSATASTAAAATAGSSGGEGRARAARAAVQRAVSGAHAAGEAHRRGGQAHPTRIEIPVCTFDPLVGPQVCWWLPQRRPRQHTARSPPPPLALFSRAWRRARSPRALRLPAPMASRAARRHASSVAPRAFVSVQHRVRLCVSACTVVRTNGLRFMYMLITSKLITDAHKLAQLSPAYSYCLQLAWLSLSARRNAVSH